MRHTVMHRLSRYDRFLLACSGGLDSTVLLHLLDYCRNARSERGRPIRVRAVHVEHRLTDDADAAAHCARRCRVHGIPLHVVRADCGHPTRNVEETARAARYRVLRQSLREHEALLTAHHRNDQTETFLLALKRGSGPRGLSCMAVDSEFHGHRLLRPLLSFDRARLRAYADRHELTGIEDSSNADCRFDRNFLRAKILPRIVNRWKSFHRTVARSAALCREQEALLDRLLESMLSKRMRRNGSLDVSSLDGVYGNVLIRRWLRRRGARMPTRKRMAILWNEVVMSRRDAVPEFTLRRHVVRRFRGCLYCLPRTTNSSAHDASVLWDTLDDRVLLPSSWGRVQRTATRPTNYHTLRFAQGTRRCFVSIVRAARRNERVSIGFGGAPQYVHLAEHTHRTKLKTLWKNLSVPPWMRNAVPLLFYDDQLVSALGFFVTQQGRRSSKPPMRYLWTVESWACGM